MLGRRTRRDGATLVRDTASRCGTGLEVRGRPVVRNDGELVIGDDVIIASSPAGSHLVNLGQLHVGNNVVIGQGAAISCHERVIIGDDVVLGAYVAVMDSDFHAVGSSAPPPPRPVTIERGARLGARVVVLPGAHIGAAAVVRAGSVVSGVIPPAAHVGGNPAAVLGTVESTDGVGGAAELVQRVFRLGALPADTDGMDSIDGWDSLGSLELVVELESVLGRRLSDDEIRGLRTVADVAALLPDGLGGSAGGGGQSVAAIVARTFGLASAPAPSTRPTDIPGWDSLGALELIIALEQTFGTKIDERRFAEVQTVGDLAQLLG
jgi:acyl carrier protein/acetyltransferase-like isoleucine patch superfamily enzyme